MSDPSLDYARRVYNDIKRQLVADRANAVCVSLVIVGEQHSSNDRLNPSENAAYAEIGALEAAARLVGSDKVILSVELPKSSLEALLSRIRANGGRVPSAFATSPAALTIAHAMQRGFIISASDPEAFNPEYQSADNTSEPREKAMRDSIEQLSKVHADGIVVHIGGVSHLSNLSGYLNTEITDLNGNLTRESQRNPFSTSYSSVTYINAFKPSETVIRDLTSESQYPTPRGIAAKNALAELNFATNPENALQVYTTEPLSPVVEISQYVREASLSSENTLSNAESAELNRLKAEREAITVPMRNLEACAANPDNTINFCLDQFRAQIERVR